MTWLDERELRIGLGCMRLSDAEPIAAALDAGMTVFDTARAYDGNERLLARALHGAQARVVTKGGMSREGNRWVPDGRAKTLRSDCEASLEALDGLPIDLYLIHAPDPRVPWRTTVRALAKLHEEKLVSSIGISNVDRRRLDEAVELAPIAAVQVGLSVFDDRALRGGLVERCSELDITLIAHSPLGGPRRTGALARDATLSEIAAAREATPAQIALAWLLGLAPTIVAIPGARRAETARTAARAASLELAPDEHAAIGQRFGAPPRAPAARRRVRGEVVLIMGIPGSGKSRLAEEYVDRGYVRLNRDARGGSLRALAAALEDELAGGARCVVLDNTYLGRADRSRPLEAALRFGLQVRCVWMDTSLSQAQINVVERLLQRFGRLPEPDELAQLARTEQGVLAPTSQMRAVRQLEPPLPDEGFAAIERIEFTRVAKPGLRGVFVAAAALDGAVAVARPDAPHLVFDWRPEGTAEDLDAAVARLAANVHGPVEAAVCAHGGGPPVCWCRPPLPGLPLAFARMHGVDPGVSILFGASAAHRTLAQSLGARYADADESVA